MGFAGIVWQNTFRNILRSRRHEDMRKGVIDLLFIFGSVALPHQYEN